MAHLLPKLRCDFAEFLHKRSLKRLGILSPSTCVGLRYGHLNISLEVFLGGMELPTLRPEGLGITPRSLNRATDFPIAPSYTFEPPLPTGGSAILLRHPIVQTMLWRYRNVDLFSIDYAFRPRLRNRLTLRRLALRRNPWTFGERVFHPLYRYSCQHSHF